MPAPAISRIPDAPLPADTERNSGADDGAFGAALERQSVALLATLLDPGASPSLPGAGVALATLDPARDASSAASFELSRPERSKGLRERGGDAASRAHRQLSSRTATEDRAGADASLSSPSPGARASESAAAASEPAAGDRPTKPGSADDRQHGSGPNVGAAATQRVPVPGTASERSDPAVGTTAVSNGFATRLGGAQARRASAPATRLGEGVPLRLADRPAEARVLSIERAPSGSGGAAATRGAKPAGRAAEHDATAQVQRGLAQVLRQRGGTLHMKLAPAELGEVRIALRIERGRVGGTIEAGNDAARELLSRNLDALKASLERRGVTVDRLDVRLNGAAESGARPWVGSEYPTPGDDAHAGGGSGRHTHGGSGGDSPSGGRAGAPWFTDESGGRGAALLAGDDGHGGLSEHAGGMLRLDTVA